jgi:3-oxoacyl-[acyl-carrier-protein] synthase II
VTRRVVITGIGMVSPLGASYDATIEALNRGHSAIAPLTLFDASGFVQQHAAEVRGFEPREYFRVPKAMKLTDRTTRFAVAAAAMALQDAAWPFDEPRDRLGVVIGSSGSDLQARELARALETDAKLRSIEDIPFFADRILSGLNPLWLLVNLPNMPSSHVGIQLGARGPNNTIMTDWVAGSQAIGEAADWIRDGDADAVLAGGADTALQPFAYASYEQTAILTDLRHGRPGFIPAEGAAVLLLEDYEHAQQRGARIRAELVAVSTACSARD